MDNDAQLFTLDLLLALVPLTIVLGMSANTITGLSSQIQGYVYDYSMQRLTNDAVDVLVKSPGTPVNWNVSNPPNVLGLAKYNTSTGQAVTNYLDERKVGGINGALLERLIGKNTGGIDYYNLSISSASKDKNFAIDWSSGTRSNTSNIFVANRYALLKVEEVMGSVFDVGHMGTTPCFTGTGPGKPPIWYIDFYIDSGELNAFDFWLYGIMNKTGVTSKYEVDTTDPLPDVSTDCSFYSPMGGAGDQVVPCSAPPDNEPGGAYPNSPSCDETYNGGQGRIYRILIDSQLVEGRMNRVLIEASGNPAITEDYYILKAPSGTMDTSILPALAEVDVVKVTLEVGS